MNSKKNTDSNSILIVLDNFLIGGRETYISTCLSAFADQSNTKAHYSLLTSNHDAEKTQEIFDVVGVVNDSEQIVNWQREGDKLIEKVKPDLVWVHHYAILPALLLAAKHNLRLVITLHGAPFSHGKFSVNDALGLALALQFGASLTAVSEEIRTQLFKTGVSKAQVSLTPNCVPFKKRENSVPISITSKQSDTLECVLFTRPQKLDHIRAAFSLAAVLNRHTSTRLTLYSGLETGDTRTSDLPITRLLGRKWLLKRPSLWLFLTKFEIKPAVKSVAPVIEEADVVLGMGRVLLEGLAANRLGVLIGYNEVIGVLNEHNFQQFQHSNFSGRDVQPQPISLVAQEIIRCHIDNKIEPPILTEQQQFSISIKRVVKSLSDIFASANRLSAINHSIQKETQLLDQLAGLLNSDNKNVFENLLSQES